MPSSSKYHNPALDSGSQLPSPISSTGTLPAGLMRRNLAERFSPFRMSILTDSNGCPSWVNSSRNL